MSDKKKDDAPTKVQEKFQKDVEEFQTLLNAAIKKTNISLKAQITPDGPAMIPYRLPTPESDIVKP